MKKKRAKPPSCSRCKFRFPMDGAGFCEWCAGPEDVPLVVGGKMTVIARSEAEEAALVAEARRVLWEKP